MTDILIIFETSEKFIHNTEIIMTDEDLQSDKTYYSGK